MKNKKKDILNILILVFIVLIYVLVVTKFGKYLYGSTYDWESQHFPIPDYFRKLFYSTGNIFPNFSLNYSQNIFYFSYYGLFSPVILLSYLLPFISMVNYIQIVSILSVLISSILIYIWCRKNNNEKISLLASIIFLCATPILFHSHRHIMFIIYMPYLILGLFGVDKYFKENKKSLLIISIFLIIMSNYFFSVSAISSLVIYGIYKYIEKTKEIKFKQFIIDGFKFLIPILIGVLMSSIIIIPTFYVLLEGRDPNSLSINILELLIPKLDTSSIFYSYSLGLLSFVVIAIIDNFLSKKKEDKFLSIVITILLLFPISIYILNGTLYVNYKVLIPYVPLCTFMIINTIKRIINKEVNINKLIIGSAILSVLFIINKSDYNILFIIETLILLITIKLNKKNLLFYLTIFVFVINIFIARDSMYLRKNYEGLINTRYEDELNEILNNDDNIYRVTNSNYILQGTNYVTNINEYKSSIYSSTSNKDQKDFYYNLSGNEVTERSYAKVTNTRNIFYNMFIGNKYYISNGYDMVGYNKISDNVYKNDYVLPIIYGNKNVMSKNDYNNLSFPYNMEAQLKYIIINDDVYSNYMSNINKIDLNTKVLNKENLDIKKDNNHYKINSKNGKLNLEIKDSTNILITKFKVNTIVNKDLSITINGIKNILTASEWKYHNKNYEFKYVISSNKDIDKLEILFSNGDFDISDLETYIVDYNTLKEVKNNIDEFKFDKKKTKGDKIVGSINASFDEYVTITIPYDKGFKILVDEKEVKYEKINNNFIGFKVNKGNHNIEITYISPGFNIGKILTFIGFNLFILMILFDKYKTNNYKKVKENV